MATTTIKKTTKYKTIDAIFKFIQHNYNNIKPSFVSAIKIAY